jgi:CHAT domain-containing protein/Flp pilus assembly protein TadD
MLLLGQPPSPEAKLAFAALEQVYYRSQQLPITDSAKLFPLIRQLRALHAGRASRELAQAELYGGIFWHINRDYATAQTYYERALQVRQAVKPALPDSSFLHTYTCLAEVYQIARDHRQVAHYLEELAEPLARKYPRLPNSSRAYNLLGSWHLQRGNPGLAVHQFRKAQELARHADGLKPAERQNDIIIYTNNLGRALQELGRNEEAKNVFVQIVKLYPVEDEQMGLFYSNLANAYLKLGQPDSALFFLNRIVAKGLLDTHQHRHVALRHLGTAHGLNKNFPAASRFFAQAERFAAVEKRNPQVGLANTYLEWGRMYAAQHKWPEALRLAQRAIINLHRNFADSSLDALPPLANLVSQTSMLQALQAKAQWQLAAWPNHPAKALRTYGLCVSLMDSIRNGYEEESFKMSFTSRMYSVYEEAIGVALRQGQAELAFQFADRSKANALRSALQSSLASNLLALRGAERGLRKRISDLQDQLIRTDQRKAPAAWKALNDSLTVASQEYQRFIRQLERENPRYYQLKYASKVPTVADLQRRILAPDQALVEYFLGEKKLFIFLVTANDFVALERDLPAEFHADLAQVLGDLANLREGYEPQAFRNQMRYWNQQLFGPVLPQLQAAVVTRLAIVPDGPLHKLPFDAFLDANGRYLVWKYALTRVHSASLLATGSPASRAGKGRPSDSLLVVAPFADLKKDFTIAFRDSLASLPYTREEADTIRHIYPASVSLSMDRAKKETFKQVYQRFGLLHLATHASANEDNPMGSYIAFYPQGNDSLKQWRLYAPEVYEMDFSSTSQVVLSACATGTGLAERGEGMLSLARAFNYAGCPNLVMTLWQANDKYAKEINLAFYQYLQHGEPTDVALQKAKIDLLNRYGSDTNPYFWANYVFIGEPRPLASKSGWWLAAVAAAVGLAGLGGWRRARRRA